MTLSKNPFRDRAGKWLAFILGTIWLSIGCTPSTLSFLAMPFVDDKIEPACKLAEKKEDVTVAILVNFAHPEINPDVFSADGELASLFTNQLRKRMTENKEKARVLSPAKVRDYQKKPGGEGRSLYEIGKHFKADKVVALEINSMSLTEPNSPMFYRGSIDIGIQVVDARRPEGDGMIYSGTYRTEFPRSRPIETAGTSPLQFREVFLNRVAGDLTRFFTAYPREQRMELE